MIGKHSIYLLISISSLLSWNLFLVDICSTAGINWFVNTYLIFLVITILMIILPGFNLVDLDIRDYQRIWWSRVCIIVIISGSIGYFISFKNMHLQSVALLKYDKLNFYDDLYLLPWPPEKYDLAIKNAIDKARKGKPFTRCLTRQHEFIQYANWRLFALA